MGPWGGFLTGLAENMEYVITPAVVVGAIGLLMQEIVAELFDVTGTPWWNSLPFWWAVFYVIFVGINVIGIEATMRFTVVITVLAIAVLVFFFLAAIFSGKLDFDAAGRTSRRTAARSRTEAVRGCRSASAGSSNRLPFAIWFYLAIEEAAARRGGVDGPEVATSPKATDLGDAHAPDRGDPGPVHQHGAPGWSLPLRRSRGSPLLDGFDAIFGTGSAVALLGLLFVIGLVASFFTIIFAYGRNTYSLSRAGYFPQFLSKTHGTRKTPHVALIAGAVVGYAVSYVVYLLRQKEVADADRGGAPQHGGVRRRDLLHVQMAVVRPAPPEHAEHRAAVPEPVGRAGRGHRRHPRSGLADRRSS